MLIPLKKIGSYNLPWSLWDVRRHQWSLWWTLSLAQVSHVSTSFLSWVLKPGHQTDGLALSRALDYAEVGRMQTVHTDKFSPLFQIYQATLHGSTFSLPVVLRLCLGVL